MPCCISIRKTNIKSKISFSYMDWIQITSGITLNNITPLNIF